MSEGTIKPQLWYFGRKVSQGNLCQISWGGHGPPGGGGGGGGMGENENFSNASPFLHMQGPFVPNFSEIGQLVKKSPWGGAWTPGGGGIGENENFSNASPFQHMQGPFVPNLSEIGQLVKKSPPGGDMDPPPGGEGGRNSKN